MARKPETTWEILDVAMSHYQAHIASKKVRCSLSIIDLLHISNFKGGNASITEPSQSLGRKLGAYERILEDIESVFHDKHLVNLNDHEMSELKVLCTAFLALTKDAQTKIRGLGPSYASAILAAHFQNLIPILDRRVLNGAGIAVDLDSQKQVKNIANYYSFLIDEFRNELKNNPSEKLRELDKRWFSKPLAA